MMTDEQITKILLKHLLPYDESGELQWWGKEEQLLKFAQEIRKQTIDEILTTLEEVPNPEANRTAINRIRGI